MYTKILVPIDGSPTSLCAVTEAAGLASLCGAKIHLLHVVDMMAHTYGSEPAEVYLKQTRPHVMDAGESLLARTRAELEADGIKVETDLRESLGERVSHIIVERATACGADLIVLGTHGLRGINRVLMGSDAEQVARTAPVPVMLVRLNTGKSAPG